jgi:hypothetical protein
MSDPRDELEALVGAELARPAPAQAALVTEEVRRRHGSAVRAVLFYGSCLRKQRPDEGVLDLYALVGDYASAYGGTGALSLSNAALPPNVFYVELDAGASVVRAKYAVISLRDFARAAEPDSLHAIVWGRFSQPSLLAWAEGDATRAAVVRACAQSIATMVLRTAALMAPPGGAWTELQPEALWQRGFRETYGTELRTERTATIASLYAAAPERYDRCARLALAALARDGLLELQADAGRLRVRMPEPLRRRLIAGWKARRTLAKSLYALRLIKSAVTFGDWLPYAAWKLARHTGVRVEMTERQRRHPLVYGWPIILRLLRQQKLR